MSSENPISRRDLVTHLGAGTAGRQSRPQFQMRRFRQLTLILQGPLSTPHRNTQSHPIRDNLNHGMNWNEIE